MQPTMTTDINDDQAAEAPKSREELPERAFHDIIKLYSATNITEKKRNAAEAIFLLSDSECILLEKYLNEMGDKHGIEYFTNSQP